MPLQDYRGKAVFKAIQFKGAENAEEISELFDRVYFIPGVDGVNPHPDFLIIEYKDGLLVRADIDDWLAIVPGEEDPREPGIYRNDDFERLFGPVNDRGDFFPPINQKPMVTHLTRKEAEEKGLATKPTMDNLNDDKKYPTREEALKQGLIQDSIAFDE